MKFNVSNIELSNKDKKRELDLPTNPSKELAEFIGILTGDGYINYYPDQHKYLLEIYGDSRLDKEFLTCYVKNIISTLFNIKPSVVFRKNQNCMYLRVISKGLVNYLTSIGFKKGVKKEIPVPKWINENYMHSFIRGFTDTDGSIYFRKDYPKYPIISIASISKPLIETIFDFIKKEGFRINKFYEEKQIDNRTGKISKICKIKLYGTKNLDLWEKKINFRNKRHSNKINAQRDGNDGI